uniref:adhesion G protein-coupled receptor F5-like isoform X2 n=1 Tax=Doryrhamphus excisus TaxID=161450 RepID=UPI0025AE4CEA|nr:adhesion G protein-coupled receptor F5-like isoform X2 [Doryrhamphus excisus]
MQNKGVRTETKAQEGNIDELSAEMSLSMAARFGSLLLLSVFFFWQNLCPTQSFNTFFFKEVTPSQSHGRQKRDVPSGFPHFTTNPNCPAPNCSLLVVDIVLTKDLPLDFNGSSQFIDQLRDAVKNITFNVTTDLLLTGLSLTTACKPNSTGGQQCRCEDEFEWPSDVCDTFDACNASAETCDCLNRIPSNGRFCEPISSIIPFPPPIEAFMDVVITAFDPNNTDPSQLIAELRDAVNNLSLPSNITNGTVLTSLNLTTGCHATLTGEQLCQCEEQFAWSCDFCDNFGACSDANPQTCDCINAIPQVDQYCEPISLIPPCPLPSQSIEVDIVITVFDPNNTDPTQLIVQLRDAVNGSSLPSNITNGTVLTSLNLTTGCYVTLTGEQLCQCEEQFAWSCDFCDTFGACSDANPETCDCINAIPQVDQYCEPISLVPPCPLPPQPIEVDVVITVFDPNNTDPTRLIAQLRDAVNNLSLPSDITNDTTVTRLNLTTGCYVTSTGDQLCQCEEQFAWSCDFCDTFGACSDANPEICDCINAIPQVDQYCEPISLIPPCPSPTIEALVDIVLTVFDPNAMDPLELIAQLRDAVNSLSLPSNITNDTVLTSLQLTTTCFLSSIGEQRCQCEPPFSWPCEVCETIQACSDASPVTCTCLNGFPPNQQFCGLDTINTICPVSTTSSTTVSSTNLSTLPQPDVRSLSVIIDIEFDPLFNDVTNPVYVTFSDVVNTQAEIHIPELLSAEITNFSPGSTIGNFEITASTTIQDPDVEALLAAILNSLRNSFPVVFESPIALDFQPPVIFNGQTLVVTCGPPPENLEIFPTSVEWRLDGVLIVEDEQHISSQDGRMATLTILNYFFTDNGFYECELLGLNFIFRQSSNGEFVLVETPIIQVRPLLMNILCEVGQQVSLECSVQSPFQVEFPAFPVAGIGSTVQNQLPITDCSITELMVICQVSDFNEFSQTITVRLFTDVVFTCVDDPDFGNGFVNDTGRASCRGEDVGEMTAICRESGEWEDREDNCIHERIAPLLLQSMFLTEMDLEEFLDTLSQTILDLSMEVAGSPNNIMAVVTILDNVGIFVTEFLIEISQESMEDVLITTGVLTIAEARPSWDFLNAQAVTEILGPRIVRPRNESISSLLLFSLESITSRLINATFSIETPLILLNKTTFIDSFNADFNSTVEIEILETNATTNLTVITFESMDNVLPPRDENNSTNRTVNGRVVLLQSSAIVDNITFIFDIINDTLTTPQCVFWNFSLFEGLGGWDEEGCRLVGRENETVTCQCDHLTSFSVLMSPFAPRNRILDFITFIGVAISLASLVICLIIEAVIWKKVRRSTTSYLRHVSIVNIAVSLLIANIWFIIGSSISENEMRNPSACTAATFFIHFFYLALFFWMFASALLLFYRTVSVFEGGLSKTTMLIIGFCLGYGAPLVIVVITIAVTAPDNTYIQETVVCWLNWNQSRALLAFVIPALLIVFINFIILIVVIIKILLSRGMAHTAQQDDKYALLVIGRSLAALTPFFGITWSLGVGTLLNPRNLGIHIAFAFFNSLQGFFILVFGTLLDKKVRSEISLKSLTSGTRTTSGNSSSGWQFFRNLGKRGGNNVSSSNSGFGSSNQPQTASESVPHNNSGLDSEAINT